jgi:carboxyl-terminal processing protease
MRNHRTLLTLVSGALLGFVVAIAGEVIASREARQSMPLAASESAGLPWQEAQLLAEVLERVKREYVEPVEDRELLVGAVRGLVSGLDPYSTYLDRNEYDDLRVSTSGSYPGVGIEVAPATDAIRIVRAFDASPAARAGLRPGDLVTAIDSQTVGADVDAAIARMRGPEGSMVRLSVRREGEQLPLEFILRRAQVDVHSVVYVPLERGYGYVRIAHFSDTTAQDFAAAVAELKRASGGGVLDGLVIDLRNNPGGVLEAAVEVADAMLERGTVVSADGRTADARFTMDATPGELLAGTRIVVLMNSGSASAAEILAGALKDHRRAQLVGRTTFGKGSVQTVMPLSQGRAIKLTTSHYFTPSGRSIDGRGIDPDVVLTGTEPEALDLDDADTRANLAARDADIASALAVLHASSMPGASVAQHTENVR